MKNTILFIALAFGCFTLFSCGKEKKEVDVKNLVIGTWNLKQYKQDNQPWRDSLGTTYVFISDTLVNTKIRTFECERKYRLQDSQEGLKHILMFPNYSCYFQDWWSFSVVSIDNSSMEITYPDEVGGLIVRKGERYVRE